MELTTTDVRELELTLSKLASVAELLCDKDTNRKVADLCYLMAELRVLSMAPRDMNAINRFINMLREDNE